jgi:nitroreductase
MNIIDFIINRRSIRKYTGKAISDDILFDLIKAGMYAPSASNKQPWHFIIVKNKEMLIRISDLHPYASMLKQAAVAIVICGDEQLSNTPAYWPIDCAAATQNILLATHGLNLGGVWLGVYPREGRMNVIGGLFELPLNIKVFSIISLGYPAEKKSLPDRFKKDRIHFEGWGKQ